jgi:hypothetical protein
LGGGAWGRGYGGDWESERVTERLRELVEGTESGSCGVEQGRDGARGGKESHRQATSGLEGVVWTGVGSEVVEAVVV